MKGCFVNFATIILVALSGVSSFTLAVQKTIPHIVSMATTASKITSELSEPAVEVDSKQVVRQYVEAFNRGDIQALDRRC